jgi:hypothetical protein
MMAGIYELGMHIRMHPPYPLTPEQKCKLEGKT